MRKLAILIFVTAVLAALGAAQGPRGGFGPQTPYTLVTRKDVGKELKLTDDQGAKIRAAQDDMGQKRGQVFQDNQGDMDAIMKGMTKLNDEFATTVKGIISADQFKRLLEIHIQRTGTMSVTDADVQKAIKLTDDQVKEIKGLQDKQAAANRSLFQKVGSGELDRTEAFADMQKNNDALKTAIEKVLTDANKADLKTAGGEAFTFDKDEPFGGGFGRPPGGGGGGGN